MLCKAAKVVSLATIPRITTCTVPNGGSITVLDQACHLVGMITLPAGATAGFGTAAAYDPVNQLMYVTAGNVYVISGLTVKHTIKADMKGPNQMVWDPNASMMLVLNFGNGYDPGWVDGIQGTRVVTQVYTAPSADGICYDPHTDTVVALSGWGFADVINASSLDDYGEVGIGSPFSCAYNPVNHYVYVSLQYNQSLAVLDGNNLTLVGSVYSGGGTGIAWDPASQDMWVAEGEWNLSIISGFSVVQTIALGATGAYPTEAYDAQNHSMYVTDGNEVYVVS